MKYVKHQLSPISDGCSLLGHSSSPGWIGNFDKQPSWTKLLSHCLFTITMNRSILLVSLICFRGMPSSWQMTSISNLNSENYTQRKQFTLNWKANHTKPIASLVEWVRFLIIWTSKAPYHNYEQYFRIQQVAILNKLGFSKDWMIGMFFSASESYTWLSNLSVSSCDSWHLQYCCIRMPLQSMVVASLTVTGRC